MAGISVLIPVYNGAAYLDPCLRSVAGQTLAPEEIVVVDDGSEDATPSVAAAWERRIRYLRVPHGGLAYARNHALRVARGALIAFLDADDLWMPQKLSVQAAALAAAAAPAMVFGAIEAFLSEDLSPDEAASFVVPKAPLVAPSPSTLLMRREDCLRVGPFDESLAMGEFIEWCARATDAGLSTIMVPEVLCRRRIHRNNISRRSAGGHPHYARMLKKVLDRRRQNDPGTR